MIWTSAEEGEWIKWTKLNMELSGRKKTERAPRRFMDVGKAGHAKGWCDRRRC